MISLNDYWTIDSDKRQLHVTHHPVANWFEPVSAEPGLLLTSRLRAYGVE
jgi:hypothetical protein